MDLNLQTVWHKVPIPFLFGHFPFGNVRLEADNRKKMIMILIDLEKIDSFDIDKGVAYIVQHLNECSSDTKLC